MKKQLAVTTLLILLPLLFASCVSSLLKEKPPVFSDQVEFNNPEAPFVKTSTAIYPSWKNSKNGNVIALFSNCSEERDFSFSELHSYFEQALSSSTVVKEEQITFQGRPANSRIIKGLLDGKEIEINSLAFKRKHCGYVRSLSGKTGSLDSDLNVLEQFTNSLRFK